MAASGMRGLFSMQVRQWPEGPEGRAVSLGLPCLPVWSAVQQSALASLPCPHTVAYPPSAADCQPGRIGQGREKEEQRARRHHLGCLLVVLGCWGCACSQPGPCIRTALLLSSVWSGLLQFSLEPRWIRPVTPTGCAALQLPCCTPCKPSFWRARRYRMVKVRASA